MWPVVAHGEFPTFGPKYGPPAYLDNLATRQLSRRHKLAFGAGDFQPYLVQADRSWLFYQGPGGHMWAYQVSSGKIRASSTPCCSYAVMAAFPSGHR